MAAIQAPGKRVSLTIHCRYDIAAFTVSESLKGAAYSIRYLHWPCSIYSDTASAEVRAFILCELCRAVQSCCQGSEFVFILDLPPSPTVNQSCQCGAIQSLPHCYKIREAHRAAVRSSIWPLSASRGAAIASHHPYGASDHVVRSSINCL